MAWKGDSFWEKHPQVSASDTWMWGAPPRPRQGLRLKPRFRIPEDALFVWTFLVLLLLHQIAPGLFRPLLNPVTFPAFILLWWVFFNGVIPAFLSRYYLFDAVAGAFVSRKPMHRFDVLRCVASDPVLMEHLGESDWRRAPVGIGWSMLYNKVVLVACAGLLAVGALATALYGDNVKWLLNIGLLSATTACVAVVYRRIAPSRPRGDFQGLGAPPDDSDRIPYDRVTAATIHWDRLAQREYLLLEHDGGMLRYYNFTGDPLYLLRLMKLRMPGAELRVPSARV